MVRICSKEKALMDTFWYFLFVLLILVPVIVVWMGCVIDVVARPNTRGIVKFLWVIGMFVFPIIGCLVYLITRPKDMVVVSEPGMYDQLYANGPYEFPTSSRAGSDVLGRSL